MHRRRLLALLVAVLLVLGLVSVGNGQAPRRGGVLRSYFSGDLQAGGLDPARFTGLNEWAVAMDLYNGLVQFDERNQIAPDLAERWSVSSDNRTYTFTLRRGVRFHNGRELTAQDVKYSLERLHDPATKSPNTWIFEDIIQGAKEMQEGRAREISGIRAVDARTVSITLKQPTGHFLALLTMPQAFVLAKEEVDRWGADYVAHPVGTGPFKLKEWRRQDRIILEANPDYFAGPPRLDGQEIRVIPEESTQEAEFKAGRLDFLSPPLATFRQWIADPQWKDHIARSPEMAIVYIAFNLKKKPWDDVRVRRAVAYAIPRRQIIEQVLSGRGVLAHGPIPPGLPGYDAGIQSIPYDPSRAKALLAEAGYADGVEAEFLTTTASTNRRIFEILQGVLRGSKITLRPALRERAVYFRERSQGQFDLVRADWFADYLDAENFLFPLFHSQNSYQGYRNPQVDALIERARATVDAARRVALYRQAERLIVADAPWVFLWHPVTYTVVQPRVQNWKPYPTPRRTDRVWLSP